MQFIPARGRKHEIIESGFDAGHIAIYPREGTETRKCQGPKPHSQIAIYPREGTETTLAHKGFKAQKLQFIPARGRKPGAGGIGVLHGIAIYPREGTETFFGPSGSVGYTNCNLSPRGDGNVGKFRSSMKSHAIAIYPREGTETPPLRSIFGRVAIAIYPREGTETVS